MRNLNPRVRKPIMVRRNVEGGLGFDENTSKRLYSIASNFKLRNSAYWNAEDKMRLFEQAIDGEKDYQYKLGLSVFLSDYLGIRLSPVVMLSRLAKERRDTLHTKSAVAKVMDRPDKITNALAYAEYAYGDAKDLPPFYKRALKDALEKFDAYTLRKFKMKRRKVSMAHAIKILHPHPRNITMSRLYKAILENSKDAAIEKDTVITEVLSNVSKTKEEKKAWVSTNIHKLPLNALIRNMNSIEDTDANLDILKDRLMRALKVVDGIPVTKVFNPFDLLEAIEKVSMPKQFIILSVLDEFTRQIKLCERKKVSFLVDISGSMWGDGIDTAKKYFSVLLPALRFNEISIHAFNTRTHKINFPFRDVQSVIENFDNYFKVNGGTALYDSIRNVIRDEKPDLLIVFSDEVTWADKDVDLIFDTGVPTIAVNPSPYSKATAFNPDKNVIKLSSIDAKILYFIPILVNFNGFKKWIKSLIL